jgi:hypothetical protein
LKIISLIFWAHSSYSYSPLLCNIKFFLSIFHHNVWTSYKFIAFLIIQSLLNEFLWVFFKFNSNLYSAGSNVFQQYRRLSTLNIINLFFERLNWFLIASESIKIIQIYFNLIINFARVVTGVSIWCRWFRILCNTYNAVYKSIFLHISCCIFTT